MTCPARAADHPCRRTAAATIAAAIRAALHAALVGALVLSLSGCRLPGGAPSGDHFRVTAEFGDVLDLVPQAAVKVNDVTVGSVERIALSGWTARVTLAIDSDVELPANATAAVRQTSLLGEKYVALTPPATEPARGRLADGAVIRRASTDRSVEVEEVLASLGLLLNGGGLAQIKTINQELTKALAGRESAALGALRELDEFVAGLDAQKRDILRAIDALDRFSAHLAQQRETIGDALDALGPGLTVLADQRQQLTAALTALGKLSTVGTRVINASREVTAEVLASLRPILEQLVRAGDSLPKAMSFLLTFPFPPNVTGAVTGNAVRLHVTLDLDGAAILKSLLVAPDSATPDGATSQPPVSVPDPADLPELPGLPLPTPSPTSTSGGGGLCEILGLPIGCDS